MFRYHRCTTNRLLKPRQSFLVVCNNPEVSGTKTNTDTNSNKIQKYNTIQYNTIQYNTIQYNTIQYNTIVHTIQLYNTIQYNTIQYNTIQYNTIQYNTIQYLKYARSLDTHFSLIVSNKIAHLRNVN